MKQIPGKESGCTFLKSKEDTAIVLASWLRYRSIVLDMQDCQVFELPCLCDDCMHDHELHWADILRDCQSNKITTLVLDEGVVSDAPHKRPIGIVHHKTLPHLRFREFPYTDGVRGTIKQFKNKTAMLRWCLSQPKLLFVTKSVSQYGGHGDLNFIQSVAIDRVQEWLAFLRNEDSATPDLERFLGRLTQLNLKGAAERINPEKLEADLFSASVVV